MGGLPHQLCAATHRGQWESIGECLTQDHEIWLDPITLSCTPRGDPEAGLDLIEYQHRADLLGLLAQHREPFEGWFHHHYRLDHDTGELIPILPYCLSSPLDVVEGQCRVERGDRLRDSRGPGFLPAIEPAMITTGENSVPSGCRSGDAKCRRGRLRSRLVEADLLHPWQQFVQTARQFLLENRRQGTNYALLDRVNRGLVDLRMSVAKRYCSECHDEVGITPALLIPHCASLGAHHPERQ